ncbi:phosphatidylglycerol lysyltransferase domain-containing protein [Streptomyces cocklensis]|nr:phosphatidylglycerol lysyltransferase domain-containing protein [Actinacidiphila cocklensis]MDD1058261.1 phosphatidylglycerol lysyltransferase domain-containing protein [Actinacidiphila cocklensis]
MGHWSLTDAVRVEISGTGGRTPLFLLLAGLLGSFLFIRLSTRMIRAQVSWWPGNVQPGGLHIHHVVFGQAMMLIGGVGSFAVHGGPLAHDILAVVFGVGCGLVLDEFALVLHLEDVYWREEGRQSVDAVILAVSVIGLLLIGQAPLGGYVGGTSWTTYAVAAVILGFVVLCLFKGKVWTGLLGVMLPFLAVVGALRLARPASPWARWRYGSRPRRMARAERREERIHRRMVAMKTRAMDVVAGAPSPVSLTKHPPARATIVEVPPSRLETQLDRVLRPLRDPGAAAAVWYLRLATAVNVVTGLIAPFRERVRAATNGEYVTAFLVSPGFTGAALALVLSISLRRRKRAAWILTTVLAAGYTVTIAGTIAAVRESRGHPFNWISLGLTVLFLTALLVSRPLFNVRGERGNVALGLTSLLIGAVVAVGVGTLLVHATDQSPPRQWSASLRYASVRVLTVSGLFDLPGITVPGWTDLAINLLSVALLLVVLLAFFRAPRGRARLVAADERRLRALLRVYGRRDPFGYVALRRDKSVWWTPSRDAAIVYRVVNGVALASGDPLGPRTAWTSAVTGWLTHAHRHAWVPAVANAGAAAAVAYEAAGFHGLSSGDEAVVDARAFAAGEGERVAAHRMVADAGYTTAFRRQRDLDADELGRLGQLADAWRRHPAAFPAGLGRLGDPADGDCVLAECRDPNGRTCAILLLVPWGADGLTLDLLRHDRDSGRAPVDHLLTDLLLAAAHGSDRALAGVCRLSLNITPTRPWPSADRHHLFTPYAPRWSPRYLLYERRLDLPRVAVVALRG